MQDIASRHMYCICCKLAIYFRCQRNALEHQCLAREHADFFTFLQTFEVWRVRMKRTPNAGRFNC